MKKETSLPCDRLFRISVFHPRVDRWPWHVGPHTEGLLQLLPAGALLGVEEDLPARGHLATGELNRCRR